MGHIEANRVLNASPEALWQVLSNPGTWGEWFTIHEKWMEEPPAELAAGSKMVAKIMMLGMANKIEWTVSNVVAPSRLTLGGTGMANVKTEFEFTIEPEGDGSRLTISGDFHGALIKGALAKAVEKDGLTQLDASLAKLDELAGVVA
jgi:uncharacterized protein YndB with AHSA1/START domain